MFVRVKTTPNSPRRSVQICQSSRIGEAVKQTIVRHVGIAMDDKELAALIDLAEVIRVKLEAEHSLSLPLFAPEQIAARGDRPRQKRGRKPKQILPVDEVRLRNLVEESRVIEGIQEVFGALYNELGFDKILPDRGPAHALRSVVLARIANPQSKHRTAALLEQDFAISLPLDRIYRMMDQLQKRSREAQKIVYQATRSLFPEKVDIVFFDVTTLYFESTTADELRDFGYSKDQKYHSVQVVLALATTEHGLPIGYRLFSGNTAEVKTLLECLEEWKKSFSIGHVALVADRAMMSEANLAALEAQGIEYIVAASLRKMKHPVQKQVLAESGYRLAGFSGDMAWVKALTLESGRRLITSFSSKRARKDQSDRQRILDKLEAKLGKESKASLKRLVSNQGYLKFTSSEGQAQAMIDEDKVARDAHWDGMHGVITNSGKDVLEILARYRQLWSIEESFRISKHDLKMRPVFHYTPERIQSHIAICFLAYALLRHAQYRVSLQQETISVSALRNELLRVQASILRDKSTGARYRLPSNLSPVARKIYRTFALQRSLTPTAMEVN